MIIYYYINLIESRSYTQVVELIIVNLLSLLPSHVPCVSNRLLQREEISMGVLVGVRACLDVSTRNSQARAAQHTFAPPYYLI